MDDVQKEIDYWNSTIYCYVIGANPPIYVMEGFFRRLWKNLGIGKMAMAKKGIYVVRFTTMEKRDQVLAGNIPFFYSKPMMVKTWSSEVDMCKEDISVMPIWVHLKLYFKYWGESCLEKIVKPVGRLLKLDHATSGRDKLPYVRIMVEVSTRQEFPAKPQFINERNKMMKVPIHYEWKPIQCESCKKMGHDARNYTKPIVRKDWRQKVQVVQVEGGQQNKVVETPQAKEFQLVRKPIRRSLASNEAASTHNTFEVLEVVEDENDRVSLETG
ncbi:uncharacterized protein LOC104891376 [Beta vulgaris subsp. vulgaris]|uniref:uncharacterized protein LOC104891376 n=1 Tax=Beta vulgaris subsp. vulgaris TaxID=3555 RepID=UPI0005400B31|nr:uncharacterized protein LOC104891376 [Beta vulgaris subsp. vulgaris]